MSAQCEWNRCRPWIEAALEYSDGTHTIGDVEADILAQKAFLLAGAKSALVCEVLEFPRMKVLQVFLAGGDLDEIRSADPQLCEYAREFGCARVRVIGRHGWVRALKQIGYKPTWTTVAKEISI